MRGVGMGQLAVSRRDGEELVAIGLGSCVAVAVADDAAGVAGLAHVVLPSAIASDVISTDTPAKFADRAVPRLLAELERIGAERESIMAVLIGGARMFSVEAGLDIGGRNAAAVRRALRARGIAIACEELGGGRGRTARVVVGREVTAQVAGGPRRVLHRLGAGLAPLARNTHT